jgi:hypothetical protein
MALHLNNSLHLLLGPENQQPHPIIYHHHHIIIMVIEILLSSKQGFQSL